MFVSTVTNGFPEAYTGYGPEHGGLDDADRLRRATMQDTDKIGIASTYDDLGEAIRLSRFRFSKFTLVNWETKELDEAHLTDYHEVVIR